MIFATLQQDAELPGVRITGAGGRRLAEAFRTLDAHGHAHEHGCTHNGSRAHDT